MSAKVSKEPRPQLTAALSAMGRMGIAATIVFTAASFVGRYSFLTEICVHFVNLYALAGVAGALLILPSKRWGWVLVCLVVALVNAARLAPLYTPAAGAAEPGTPLRLVTANVLSGSDRYEAVADYLGAADADLIFVQEVTRAWEARLRAALPDHRYVVTEPREDHFGIAVFSRLPLSDVEVVRTGGSDLPAIVGAVRVGGAEVRFVNLHAIPPGSPYGLELRNRQMNRAAAFIADSGGPGIVAGDFNCTSWSPYFRDLLREHDLHDARRGFGVAGTWPAPVHPFTIPIDQCLVTSEIRVLDFERGRNFGSDHLPLRVDLQISDG